MKNKSVSRKATSGMWAEVEITEGNIAHAHFYLRGFMQRFPPDLVGGSNKSELAPRSAVLDWGGPSTVETDIEGHHQFFRRRDWVRQFFAMNGAQPEDRVRIEETEPYRYRISLLKKRTA